MNTDKHGSRWWRRAKRSAGVLAGACALLLLAACSLPEAQPDLTRFYVLTAAGATGDVRAGENATAEKRRVWLKTINVPEFLRGKIMQVRLSANEVKFIDTARWAEPLESGLGRVLRENLGAAGSGIEVAGRSVDAHEFDVVVHLRSCEGVMPGGVARLAARVQVYAAGLEARQVAEEEMVEEVEGWNGKDYGDLAAKLSEAAARMSARIAALLREAGDAAE